MARIYIIISLLFFVQNGYCQFAQTNSFNRSDGLTANAIYNIVEDNQGFLWLATDAGAFRFDGKQFQLFTMDQGLPDNEVLKIMKEPNGTIWINTFKNLPAYFDNKKNKFINSKDDSLLYNLKGYANFFMNYTIDGSVIFYINDTLIAVKNRKISKFPIQQGEYYLQSINDKEDIKLRTTLKNNRLINIEHHHKNKIIESKLLLDFSNSKYLYPKITGTLNEFDVLFDGKTNKSFSKLLHYTNIKTAPISWHTDTFLFQGKVNQLSNTKNFVVGSYLNGEIEILSKQSKQTIETIQVNYLVNSVFEDSHGTLWICTNEGVLLKYEKALITQLQLPTPWNDEGYMSITKSKNGAFYLGNFKSKVIEKHNDYINIHAIPLNNKSAGWQRDIIESEHKIFTFSDAGIYVNYTKPVMNIVSSKEENALTIKTAISFNDSLCILGGVNNLISLNTKTEQLTCFNNFYHRVTSLLKYNQSILYIGSNDGIYKYDVKNEKEIPILKNNSLWQERIMSICMGKDSSIWVATACNGILVIYHDSIIAHITIKNGLPTNSLRSIAYGLHKQIGIGSELGFSILNYSASIPEPQITNFTNNDGLSSNVINKIFFEKDTFYLATNKGISIVPAKMKSIVYAIPVYIIDVHVNNKKYNIDSVFYLEKNQNSIRLQLGGVELKGHFKKFEYSVDEGNQWTAIKGNELNLQLESGKHKLWIRAIDINENKSAKPLILLFDIAIPFWKTWWFSLFNVLLFLGASFYTYQQYLKRKHKRKINTFLTKQQLDDFEIQALKAQINPHFVFNCLNSIKALIYEEKLEDADLYLNTFASLLRTTLNYSSTETISLKAELEYIDNYLQLEKLRFNNKFEYEINVDKNINQEKIQLPSMLLQPFLENAINHGVSHLKGTLGKIIVNISNNKNYLHITIDDNGIGRERAQEIKKLQTTTYESKGTQLTERRLALHKIEFEIIDKKDLENNASGTIVTLQIPNLEN